MKASLRAAALAGLVHIQLLTLSTLVAPAVAKDECQPYSWGDPTHGFALKMANKAAADDGDGAPPKAGEVNCRQQSTSPSSVNYYTCTEMADEHDISVETFFVINPKLKKDCSDIQPNTKYCVNGFIEPLRAYDGKCGPPNNNATCLGTQKQCCNSQTFTCGDNYEVDCAPGICWEGVCPGDKTWSTDGTCGAQHGNRQCAGKWGDCCSLGGKCGTGPEFCGKDNCQSGNCTKPDPGTGGGRPPWLTGNSTDGTCGGPKAYTCKVIYGNCCNKNGRCGSLPQDCGDGCQPLFGKCGTQSK
ncbi:CFEM domain-containing protein [Purpureocillium lilacinum]|uniref:CFEM domain-containing protein n=1 Tax=Purpureocillium lilacinum TaxID=33203 RepID=A0A179H626_PURLI|nr:CFEM domain-containing protein [Purpureocillium lilacinum]OAQ77785.1 CFEM domain-containing protein [Purpureocillium lilacinum]OAQ85208.1 CFEM domain-containing protein [Purpureocillium lilacinum]